MPTFHTPEPISATIDIIAGDVRIIADDRTDTVVEVRPRNAASKSDVRAAEQTHIECVDGRLLVKAMKQWRQYSLFDYGGAIEVTIELPANSRIRGNAGPSAFHGTGVLGECLIKTRMGDITLAETGDATLTAKMGDITVDRVAGTAEIVAGCGTVEIHEARGNAVVKNSYGDCRIASAAANLHVSMASGDILVDTTMAEINAKTASGNVRIRDIAGGSVVAETAMGEVEIGVREGVTSWLDVHTTFGNIRNSLPASARPTDSVDTAKIRARTSFGDIVVRRSTRLPESAC